MANTNGASSAEIKTTTITNVPYAQLRNLVDQAIGAKDRAYCPYSHFRVGCAVLTESGAIITGVNVENASYPVGTCAERCAIGRAVAEGHRRFVALAVATDITPPASPCGMCRQFLREFAALSMPIILLDIDGQAVYTTLDQLLPMSFGPADLNGHRQGQQQQAAAGGAGVGGSH